MSHRQTLKSGLFFRRLDLHVHTPASSDFVGDASPEEIVQEALNKGLDGIAITDHNTGEWIDRVKAAASGTDLTVFPGVEITCAGGTRNIHLIALFDPSRGTKHVNGLLSSLGLPPDQQGKPESIVMDLAIHEIIDKIQDDRWGGIVVPAHANSTSGILGDLRGMQRTNIIQHPGLMAVEATDFDNDELRSRHRRVIDLLDGSDPEYQRHLAVYQASDNPAPNSDQGHSLSGIGTRFTYFKVETLNLDALRQCFADPEVRILQESEYDEYQYPRIASISINGGFLDGETAEFHPGLNSILGGKGAGKSVLIELMRFALNQPPSNPAILEDHNGKLEAQLGLYGQVELHFVDDAGREFSLKRTYNPLENSRYADAEFDPAQVFPVMFLSQNEIIKLAESEEEQLAFIDQFFDFRSFRRRIAAIEEELKESDRRMAEGMRAIADVQRLRPSVESLELDIKRLEEHLGHPIFERYRIANQKRQAFDAHKSHLQNLSSAIGDSRERLQMLEPPELPSDLAEDPALNRTADIIRHTRALLEEHLAILEREFRDQLSKLQAERDLWYSDYEATVREYEEYVNSTGGNYQALAKERERKIRELQDLRGKLSRAIRLRDKMPGLSKERECLLDRLDSVYKEYTQARRDKCAKFENDSAGRLKLNILGSSNVDEFRECLLTLKQGSYLRETEIDAICESVRPRDFIIALLRYAVSNGKQSFIQEIADRAQIGLDRMTKLADFLLDDTEYEKLLPLQYKAVPQDRPEILFNVGDDTFRPLSEISVGQKSIAMLLIALSEGSRPIVIDQPEDSLDIRAIWEDICVKLRPNKRKRQFIFTTHNSSVAVASDTDKFIILEGTATSGRITHTGAMDHDPVGEEVLKYLEGGGETYKRKYKKYDARRRFDLSQE